MEEQHETVATVCIVYYDDDISAALLAPVPLPESEWHAIVDGASDEFNRIEYALEQSSDHVDTSGVTPDEMTAYDDGVIGLLRYQHPEIQSVPFVESGFH